MIDSSSRVEPLRESRSVSRNWDWRDLMGLAFATLIMVGAAAKTGKDYFPKTVLIEAFVIVALFIGVVLGVSRFLVPKRAFVTRSTLESGVQKTGGRLLFVDALRGLAAFFVVAQHSTELAFPRFFENFTRLPTPGRLGVGVFFMISGFVIVRSLERNPSPRTFWINRLLRIAPLYYAGLLVGLLLLMAGVLRTSVLLGEPRFGLHLALNLLMMAGYIGSSCVLGVYWTLGYEWAFYFLAFTLVRVIKRQVAEPFLLGIMAILIVGRLISPAWLPPFTDHFTFFGLFAIGILFHELDRGEISRRRAAALVLSFLAVQEFSAFGMIDAKAATAYLATFPPIPLVVFAIAWSLRRASVPAVLQWLGKISFSIYVVHSIVVQSLPAWPGAGVLYILAVYAITLPVATLTQRWIEEPGVALAHRWAPSRRRADPA